MASDPAPLRGLRVLDFSTGIAGPYAARVLREAGAEVLKAVHTADPEGVHAEDTVCDGRALAALDEGGAKSRVADLRARELHRRP